MTVDKITAKSHSDNTPALPKKDSRLSLVDQFFKEMSEGKPLDDSGKNFLSVCAGVPVRNNREKFKEISKKVPSIIPEELKACEEILREKTLLNHNSTLEQQREQKIRRMKWLTDRLPTLEKDGVIYRGVELFIHCFDEPLVRTFLKLMSSDPALATLWGVHYFLWGVSLIKYGTEKHIKKYLERTNTLDIVGCCMMTEIGHGSNVLDLETTAIYDHEKRGFVINTPTDTARKCWIGGGAKNATHGLLFAQLVIDGEMYGVHPFVIQLRDEKGNNLPGVTTYDLGPKFGLNGVDNGIIEFDNIFIEYDEMLDYYCEIDEEGKYIGRNGNRDSISIVYKLMVNFVFGRKYITVASEVGMALVSTLFYVYPPQSLSKFAFHHHLTNFLTQAYALKFSTGLISGKNAFNHWYASIMKAISSRMNQDALFFSKYLYGNNLMTREIRAVLTSYIGDQAATLTYEGDNILLYQLFMKHSLDDAKAWFVGLKKADWNSWRKLLSWAIHRNDPKNILLAEAFSLAKKIGAILEPLESDDERLRVFNETCQLDGVVLGKIYGYYLILEEFEGEAKKLKREGQPIYWDLYEIFAWNTVKKLAPLGSSDFRNDGYLMGLLKSLFSAKQPDLNERYRRLEEHLPQLVADFGFKIEEMMDHLIDPPPLSVPWEENESIVKTMAAAEDPLFGARL